MLITLVIPTLNEEKNFKIISHNSKLHNFSQIIVVDGGSTDKTKNKIKNFNFKLVKTLPSRGRQLREGAKKSNSEWLLFIHADTMLNKNNVYELVNFINNKKNIKKAGFFKLKFDSKLKSAKIISCWANIRNLIFRLPFGDQCLLINRKYYFYLGAHKSINIMEDIEFILRVPYKNRFLFQSCVKTSFEKYKEKGIIRQCFLHFFCQTLFFLRFSNQKIFRFYKKYG